jgi:hypothetical protein
MKVAPSRANRLSIAPPDQGSTHKPLGQFYIQTIKLGRRNKYGRSSSFNMQKKMLIRTIKKSGEIVYEVLFVSRI